MKASPIFLTKPGSTENVMMNSQSSVYTLHPLPHNMFHALQAATLTSRSSFMKTNSAISNNKRQFRHLTIKRRKKRKNGSTYTPESTILPTIGHHGSTFAVLFIAASIMTSNGMSSQAHAFSAKPAFNDRLVQVDPSFSRILEQEQQHIAPTDHPISLEKVNAYLRDSISLAPTEPTVLSSESSASTSFSSRRTEDNEFSLRKVLKVADVPYQPTAEDLLTKFPKVVGHRGCLYQELENTRAGFSRCHDMGCDAVELDVFKVRKNRSNDPKDTTLIVFHGGGTDENPGDLLDYCRIDGSILDYNYETEIREKMTFNPDFAEFPCPIEKIRDGEIPTLEEVLLDAKRKNDDPYQRNMHIKIELKGPDVVEDVLELVDSLGVASMCSYSSFDLQKIRLVRDLRPERDPITGEFLYKTGALFNHIDESGKVLDDEYYAPPHCGKDWSECDIIERSLAVGASEIHLKYDTCTKPLVDRIHSSGLGSMAWLRGPIGMGEDSSVKYLDVGNEDLSMYDALVRTGVQQMCVNKPDVLIDLRERHFFQLQQQRTEKLFQNTTT